MHKLKRPARVFFLLLIIWFTFRHRKSALHSGLVQSRGHGPTARVIWPRHRTSGIRHSLRSSPALPLGIFFASFASMKNNNHRPLESQTAIVTGASSGIGQAVAIELGASGANVLINYHRDEEGAQKTLETIERVGGRGIVLQGDVGKQEDISLMFEEVKKNFGNLHILVSNAGIQKDKAFTEMELEEWDLVIETNLYGAFLSSRMASRAFMDQGLNAHSTKAAGKIVFISSVRDIIT